MPPKVKSGRAAEDEPFARADGEADVAQDVKLPYHLWMPTNSIAGQDRGASRGRPSGAVSRPRREL
jgi:hypothetical protein